jgi:hypothetical protein
MRRQGWVRGGRRREEAWEGGGGGWDREEERGKGESLQKGASTCPQRRSETGSWVTVSMGWVFYEMLEGVVSALLEFDVLEFEVATQIAVVWGRIGERRVMREEDGCIWTLFVMCNSQAERRWAQDKEEGGGQEEGKGGGGEYGEEEEASKLLSSVPDVYAGGFVLVSSECCCIGAS